MYPLLFHQRKKLKKKIAESNLNKQTQKSIMNYRQSVTYIPHVHYNVMSEHPILFITDAKLNWEG